MSDSPHQPEAHRRHASRKTRARVQLGGVILLLGANFAMLFVFAMKDAAGRADTGVLFGGAIACALLLGAIWNRQEWARYVMVILLLLLAGYFAFCLLMALNEMNPAGAPGAGVIGAGIGGFIAAAAWIILSRRIRHLTTPPGSGG